jgi:hypothetical protein
VTSAKTIEVPPEAISDLQVWLPAANTADVTIECWPRPEEIRSVPNCSRGTLSSTTCPTTSWSCRWEDARQDLSVPIGLHARGMVMTIRCDLARHLHHLPSDLMERPLARRRKGRPRRVFAATELIELLAQQ